MPGESSVDSERVISAIYDAALDRTGWTSAIELIREHAGVPGTQLLAIDPRIGTIAFSRTAGIPKETESLYLRRYCAIDPRVELFLADDSPDGWVFDHDHFDDRFVAGNRFYQELLIPAGLRHTAGTVVYQDDGVLVILTLFKGVGEAPLSSADVVRVQRLIEHLRRAVALSNQVFRFSKDALVGVEVVNRQRYPAFLLGADRRILHANDAGTRALVAGRLLAVDSGRLSAVGSSNARLLRKAVESVYRDQIDADVPAARVVSLERGRGRPLKGFLLALHTKVKTFDPTPLIVAAFSEACEEVLPDASLLMAAYKLTRAEARVARFVATGQGVKDAAHALGRKEATIRTQLKSIFGKMGVRSQAEMVSELIALPNLKPWTRA